MTHLSIGEFARASGLTPKALRLYGELGVLVPAWVDPRSGYRCYTPHQLARARLIAALRGIGMPLARIRVVCDLSARAAAVEVRSYWRQAEADHRARGTQVHLLIEHLIAEEGDMTTSVPDPGLDHGARTDRGLVRAENQDVVFAGTRLFAVADGFGAGPDREPASAAVLAALAALDTAPQDADLGETLTAGTTAAQRALDTAPGLAGTGSTLTAMLWSGLGYAVAHVGDSRLYLLRDGELCQVTHDHTYVQSLIEDGRLTPEEAATHPERATLLRALQPGTPTEPDVHLRAARPGDRYLLCTDGLHAVVAPADVRALLADTVPATRTAECLVAAAHHRGAPDNIACVVVDVPAA